MSRTTAARTARRLAVVTAVALTSALAVAAPASAHVEVTAEDASALAENVTLTFSAESESPSAGITKLQVVLPEGIDPADVTYAEGPKGWKLATTDDGYTVSGPAVAKGVDAEYAVTVRQLPDAESLAFKTLQTYSDGTIDRWIELEEAADGGHGSPAPRLDLEPAKAGATPIEAGPSTEATTAAPTTEAASPTAEESSPAAAETAAESTDDGMSPAVPVGIGVLVVALAGGAWWWKRRSATQGS